MLTEAGETFHQKTAEIENLQKELDEHQKKLEEHVILLVPLLQFRDERLTFYRNSSYSGDPEYY